MLPNGQNSWTQSPKMITEGILQKNIFLVQFPGHVRFSFTNPVDGCSPEGPNYSAMSEKGKTDFLWKKTYFFEMLLSTRKMQLSRTCWTFREKAENFHPKFRKNESISDNTIYTFSSETSSGDVERSFDDHVDAFHGKSNIFPFSFQIWFGGKFSQGKHIIPQIVRLDTKTAVLTSCRWSFPGCLQVGPSNSKNRNSFFSKPCFPSKCFSGHVKHPFKNLPNNFYYASKSFRAHLQKMLKNRTLKNKLWWNCFSGQAVYSFNNHPAEGSWVSHEVQRFPLKARNC